MHTMSCLYNISWLGSAHWISWYETSLSIFSHNLTAIRFSFWRFSSITSEHFFVFLKNKLESLKCKYNWSLSLVNLDSGCLLPFKLKIMPIINLNSFLAFAHLFCYSTHFLPLFFFDTPWKTWENQRFSDVFRRYRKK